MVVRTGLACVHQIAALQPMHRSAVLQPMERLVLDDAVDAEERAGREQILASPDGASAGRRPRPRRIPNSAGRLLNASPTAQASAKKPTSVGRGTPRRTARVPRTTDEIPRTITGRPTSTSQLSGALATERR